jgi:hypothetical protein
MEWCWCHLGCLGSLCVCVRTIANPRRWTIEQSVKDLCIAPRQNEQYRKKNRHHHHRNNNNIIVAGLWAAGPFRVIPIRKILFFFSAEAYCQFRLLSSPAASLAQLCCVWFNWKLFGFFLSFFFYLFSPDRRRKRERVCALSDEFPTFTESDAIVCHLFSFFFWGAPTVRMRYDRNKATRRHTHAFV